MDNSTNVLAGFAETDITPANFNKCELIGFNRSNSMAKGILHPLKAQVLIFQSNVQTCCLIAVDSLSFSTALTNRLRNSIAEQLHTHRGNIMVCFSHTHSAPNAAANGATYFEFAQRKIREAANKASATMFPIKAAWGIAKNAIGVNRRVEATSMDKRIGILKITDAITNKTKLLLLRVTAHANVLTSDNYLISSDYFGPTRELLEKKHNCKVIMTQGAAGNVRSKYRQKNADFLEEHPIEASKIVLDMNAQKAIFDESIAALNKNASEIYKAVNSVIDKIDPSSIYRLIMASDILTLSADVPSVDRALEIVCEAANAGIDGEEWFDEVKSLNAGGIKSQETKREVQFFCLNNGCLCGVADEAMCEIAIDIKEKAHDNFIFFGGYTNGYEGYLPTAKEYDKGGYEVLWSNLVYYKYYNRVMPLNRDTADNLANNIVQRWKEILDKTNPKHTVIEQKSRNEHDK